MSEQKSPAQLEAEIEAQRLGLAETVDQLTAKLDVKSHARARAAEARDRATTADGKPRPEVVAAAGALVAVVVALVALRRHRL